MNFDNKDELMERYKYTGRRIEEQVFKHGKLRGIAVFLSLSVIGFVSLSTHVLTYLALYLEVLVREHGLKFFAESDRYAYNPEGDL